MPRLVKVGLLYARFGEDVVNELAEWLDQVYDARREMEDLRRDVKQILQEIRAVHLKVIERLHAKL